MNDVATHLVENVLPPVPTRQWVLTLPYALRYRLAYDRELLNVHFHTLVLDGVYAVDTKAGTIEFLPLAAPSTDDVLRVLTTTPPGESHNASRASDWTTTPPKKKPTR